VTDVSGADALGEFYINEPDQLYNVLRTQMDVVLSDGVAVLNADDALVVKMASLCDGAVIYFGLDPQQAAITEHRAKGGRTLFVRDGKIILASGAKEVVFVQAICVAANQIGAAEPSYRQPAGGNWRRLGTRHRTGIDSRRN